MYSSKIGHSFSVLCSLVRPLPIYFSGRVSSLSISTSIPYCNRKSRNDFVYKNRNTADNPGVSHRLKIINEDTPDLNSVVIKEEDVEELEGDFLNAKQMQEYYVREAAKLRFRDELKMTERKHFKPPVEPNMLTWSEKEQIKLLHREEPQDWSIDRLADSFPATPQIIKKILKSNWIPNSEERIKKHDAIVASNWKAFNEGKLNISCPRLKEHLKKFTNRSSLISTSGSVETTLSLPKPKSSEFVDIIHSYKSSQNCEQNELCVSEEEENHIKSSSLNKNVNRHEDLNSRKFPDTVRLDSSSAYINSKSNYTLDGLRVELKKNQSKHLNGSDDILMKGVVSQSVGIVKQPDTIETLPMYSSRNNQVQDSSKDAQISVTNEFCKDIRKTESKIDNFNKNLLSRNIPKRIHIPKSKVKIGYLYKVNDSYYSHDGFFLYRVPGVIDVQN